MSRRRLALLALAGLLVLSGCLGGIGGGPASDDQLDQPPETAYDWDTNTDVSITVTNQTTYRAVYDVSAFNESIRLAEGGFLGTDTPVSIRSLRYRYPNGTVINGSKFDEHGGSVGTQDNALVIEPPADDGKMAYSGDGTPKQFSHPIAVEEGSYTVVLPENRETSVPLFGRIVPAPDSTITLDGRLHIVWVQATGETLLVRYYLPRDVQLFGGLLIGLVGVGVAGGGYYWRKIKELRERREEIGLDVDIEHDDGDGPPPGMG
ncbi:DUF5803 family protein [Halolamina salifodinae]|uniref:Lipoprotein n=1 Tax=Halolamina salifodinae TaxID=1202767 RepID=A0A8T4H0Z0_9EURY|nr:DUF5803 family protein [Halolamina salifodinae]MBP1987454.1 hypothetical protein [Halolamina salifodinae]